MNGTMDELSPSLSGSITILNDEAATNENEVAELTATCNSAKTTGDGFFSQVLDRTTSPSISILSEFDASIISYIKEYCLCHILLDEIGIIYDVFQV